MDSRRVICMLLTLIMLFMFSSISYADEVVTLTIAGDAIPTDILTAFMQEYPNIRIEESETFDSTTLIQDALSHSDAVDIYFMYTLISTTYETLRDRGYFLELSDPEILDMVDSVYPEIREAVTYHDNVCALPFTIQGQPMLAVDMDCWASLGLSNDELPTTWAEALRFAIDKWPDISEKHEEIGLFSQSNAYMFLQSIENNYEVYRSKNHYEMGYDTQEFREILGLFSELCEMDVFDNESDISTEYKEGYLFWNDYVPDVYNDAPNIRSLNISFEKNEPPCYAVGFMVMAINPNSKHASEAGEVLKYVFSNVDTVDKMTLCPDINDPIISDDYSRTYAEYPIQMEAYENMIEKATSETERRALEMERDAYDKDVQNFLAEYKYLISAESLQQYRNEVKGIMVPIYVTGLSMEEYNAVNEKRIAFLQGQIQADKYIDELERRFALSVLENR